LCPGGGVHEYQQICQVEDQWRGSLFLMPSKGFGEFGFIKRRKQTVRGEKKKGNQVKVTVEDFNNTNFEMIFKNMYISHYLNYSFS
jgi:hypothetical protein